METVCGPRPWRMGDRGSSRISEEVHLGEWDDGGGVDGLWRMDPCRGSDVGRVQTRGGTGLPKTFGKKERGSPRLVW